MLGIGKIIIAGTVGGFLSFYNDPADCVYIPPDMLATSEAAFAAVNAKELRLDGLLGFHHPYNKDTGKSSLADRLVSVVALSNFPPISASDLDATDPRRLLIYGTQMTEGRIIDWRQFRDAGFTVISTSDALPEC